MIGEKGLSNEASGTPETESIFLGLGWNLVGYPSFSFHNRTVGLNTVNFGLDVDAIMWYDVTTGSCRYLGLEDLFVPGRGYYMHSKVDIIWEVPL